MKLRSCYFQNVRLYMYDVYVYCVTSAGRYTDMMSNAALSPAR